VETENTKVPAEVERRPERSLLGPPPLIAGESLVEYEELESKLAATVMPKDFLETIWVRDVVDLTWEIRRQRRIKAGFLTSVQYQGVEAVLQAVLHQGLGAPEALAKQWAARDPDAVKKVDNLLSAKGLTMDVADARALAANIGAFERIDAGIMNLETRRNAALREIERHRSNFGSALRRATDDVIDAEYRDVSPARSNKQQLT
jgi:hypothetical protein